MLIHYGNDCDGDDNDDDDLARKKVLKNMMNSMTSMNGEAN